jgi:hypothetical protein
MVVARNWAELAVYPDGAHAFNYFRIGTAKHANAHTDAFLAREIAWRAGTTVGKACFRISYDRRAFSRRHSAIRRRPTSLASR